MVVIYTQDFTKVFKTLEDARDCIFDVYGEKIGTETYKAVARGKSFRQYGGALIENVTAERARWIIEKERTLISEYE